MKSLNFVDKHLLCSKFCRVIEELGGTANSFLRTDAGRAHFNTKSDQINCPFRFPFRISEV